jgi:large subunit ribosomal protein L5
LGETPPDIEPTTPSSTEEETSTGAEPTNGTTTTGTSEPTKPSPGVVEDAEAPEGSPQESEMIPSEAKDESDVSEATTLVEDDAESREESAPAETEVKPRTRIHGLHSMRDLKIGKVVVNITTGRSGEPLDRAMTILENLTGQRPCTRRAKQTIRTWGIRRHEPIACMVSLRGGRAEEFLRRTFPAVRNRINPRSFDRNGNFAFGIREHIDIPGQRYDPNLGIVGMDIMATVERPGYRVARKRRARSRVGRGHKVTREESIEFIKQSFGVEVGLPSE